MNKRNIIIINVYRPPDCSTVIFINPMSELRAKLIEIGNPMKNIFPGEAELSNYLLANGNSRRWNT